MRPLGFFRCFLLNSGNYMINSGGYYKRVQFEVPCKLWVWQETPEEGQIMHLLKCCSCSNKDEDNCSNTLNDETFFLLLTNPVCINFSVKFTLFCAKNLVPLIVCQKNKSSVENNLCFAWCSLYFGYTH